MAPGYQADLEQLVQPLLEQVAAEVETDIKRNAPVDTGDLVRSVRRRGNIITISAPYWHFVEYGTEPHIIRPRTKQALWWPGAHHPVKMVRHPGTQAQPFIRPAALRQRRLRGISVSVG
jgi:HK97 gp10 family phage protein